MNEVIEVLKKRRSIRKYKQEQVSKEDLEEILAVAKMAPSAMNEQPWFFVVIQSKEAMADLAKHLQQEDPFYGAPTVILAFYRQQALAPVVDTTFAMGNIMQSACALGLGTCYIYSVKHLFEENANLASAYHVPEGYSCLGGLCLGIPDEEASIPERNDDVVYYIEEEKETYE